MYIGPLEPPPPKPLYTSRFAPDTLDVLREQVYGDGDIHHLNPVAYKGEITPAIERMLESIHKLSKLSSALEKFDTESLSHIQPYFDKDQHFRCYLTKSYIIFEVNHNPKNSKWHHLVEKHGADADKLSDRYYEFNIIKGLEVDEFLDKLQEGIDSIVETVEVHLFDVMHKTQTAFENIRHFRISNEKPKEIIDFNKISTLKEKLFNSPPKKPSFFGRFLSGDPNKISFS